MGKEVKSLADPTLPSKPPAGPVADGVTDSGSDVSEDRLRAGAEEALKRAGEDV